MIIFTNSYLKDNIYNYITHKMDQEVKVIAVPTEEIIIVTPEEKKVTFPCEFCKAELSTKYTLSIHQLKTKSCLEIQRQQGVFIIHPERTGAKPGRKPKVATDKTKVIKPLVTRVLDPPTGLQFEIDTMKRREREYYTKIITYETELKILREIIAEYKVKEQEREMRQYELVRNINYAPQAVNRVYEGMIGDCNINSPKINV
jgi:hypothetical protein